MSENVLILGATSGIARPLCRILAERGCRLLLAGRNVDELQKMAADLATRYKATAHVEPFDALDFDSHAEFLNRTIARFDGEISGVVLCYGYLPEQPATQTDFAEARQTIDVNFTSAVSILNLIANHLESKQQGYIAAISSVAGDRGRQSNYTYGASKAALSAYLQGLRNRLHASGVSVLTIKPGFVDTPMTAGRINPNSPLVAAAETVARDIDRALKRNKDVLYTPRIWRCIMCVVRSIPEWLFKRLKL